jgi:hypothetical protein
VNEYELEEALEAFATRVKRNGIEFAEEQLRRGRPSDADTIVTEFRQRVGRVLKTEKGLRDPDLEEWYVPLPDHQSQRWVHARSQLGLPPDVVEKTSKVADEILARLGNPLASEIKTRGLVLGHVQSGKTTSFLSVAAKALDNDYDLVIILAGVHNSLRRQTQNRSARTLVHKRSLWWLGTEVADFRSDGNPLSSHLAGDGKRGLLVVKKNSRILERLANWLEQMSDAELRETAILVIDDEADQAGLDVAKGDELEGVHKQLRRIVDLQTSNGERRCAYLAYTATPYANILTSRDEYGLYPRDFIYPLDPPAAYMGSRQLFGDDRIGHPIQIEDDSSDELLTEGLRRAIRWFVLATAARVGLGTPLDQFHSSMLVHTTQRTEEHQLYRPAIEGFLDELVREFDRDPSVMQEIYETTLAQVPAREGGGDGFIDEPTAPWGDVEPHIVDVMRRLIDRTPAGEPFQEDGRNQHAHSGVIVDNSRVDSTERLTYSDLSNGEPSVTVIAIGGNTLSRGLTLEGLICSYFARTARNYDSLMQMGRWFGYRPGYRHLIRIWTTQSLLDWFQELDLVEQELRQELVWMQDNHLAPDKYGPRIRLSPHMNITRAAAMRSIDRDVSYSDHVIDPAWLDLDPDVLTRNQQAARTLAEGLGEREVVGAGSLLFRDVPAARVRSFLNAFQFHAEEKRIDKPTLFSYLDREHERLTTWSVIYKSTGRASRSTHDHGGDVGEVNTIGRARLDTASVAFIQSLVDSNDHRLDADTEKPDDPEAQFRGADEPPLLVVYAIDPESPPRSRNRVQLDAPTTPISVSIALPRSESFVEYARPVVAEIDQSVDQMDLEDHHDHE